MKSFQLKKASAVLLGGAVASTACLVGQANAEVSPFGISVLDSGYTQMAEGKCGEGKCGGSQSSHEGKCGGNKDKPEGKCGADKQKHEGKCGGSKATQEAKCGEGKCGGNN